MHLDAQISPGTYGFDGETAGTKAGPSNSVTWTSSDNIKISANSSNGTLNIQVIGGGGVVTGAAGDHTVDIQRSTASSFTNQILESNDGSEFGLSSLYLEPVGPGGNSVTFQFEGFKDNVSTGTQSAAITYGSFHQIDLSTSGHFVNVDKVVITTTSGTNFGIGLDEIVFVTASSSTTVDFEESGWPGGSFTTGTASYNNSSLGYTLSVVSSGDIRFRVTGSSPNVFFEWGLGTGGGSYSSYTIKTNDGSELSLESISLRVINPSDDGATATFTAKKNGSTVGSATAAIARATTTFVDLSGVSAFGDIDEVVISGISNGIRIFDFTYGAASAPVAPTSATVAASVFLEGAYNGTNLNTTLNSSIPTTQPYSINGHSGGTAGSIPASAVDWVLVELRESGSAAAALNSTKVGSAAGFLMNDGTIKATDGTSDLTINLSGNTGGDFYVVIYHRNHLPIMSANAISESGGTYTIDFTSNSANTYQTTTALVSLAGGKFGMPSGDIDQDGDIDATDLSSWRSDNGGVFNYSTNGSKDLNLDGVINAVDRNDYYRKNTSKTRQVPSTL